MRWFFIILPSSNRSLSKSLRPNSVMPITLALVSKGGGLALKTEGSFFAFRLATTATTPSVKGHTRTPTLQIEIGGVITNPNQKKSLYE